jgi:glycosyltransferase involved in cell wall biosynthesis
LLNVLFDATAVPDDRRGVGRYIDSVIPALVRTGTEVHVVCRPPDVVHYSQLAAQQALAAPVATRSRPVRLIWEQLGLPFAARRAKPDVLHAPHYTYPLALSVIGHVPVVVTLHDATFFSSPEVHTRVKGPFFRTASRLALRRADQCIVVSQATADELIRHAGAQASRLTVAHLGVDSEIFKPPSDSAVAGFRRSLGLSPGEDYIAFLGTMEPRKNLPALIRGWAMAFEGRSNPPALVLAGGSGWDSELDAVAASVPAALRLIRPGYLPLEELSALLGGALVVAYPSLGEGFGLPVLEAMACGAPVLTTRRLALAEVGGDAVAYSETDPASIGRELAALTADEVRRRELGAAGLARSAQFSWDACAAAHLLAYERAVAAAS